MDPGIGVAFIQELSIALTSRPAIASCRYKDYAQAFDYIWWHF